MTLDNYISIFGSIITIVSMGVTIFYAKKAKEYLKTIREELDNNHILSIISTIKAETQVILNQVNKIGRSSTITSIKGLCIMDISRDIERYTQILNNQRRFIPELFDKPDYDPCRDINILIKKLAKLDVNTDFNEIKSTGIKICAIIESFSPLIEDIHYKCCGKIKVN